MAETVAENPLTINLAIPPVLHCSKQRQEPRCSRDTLLLVMGLLSQGKDAEEDLPWGELGSHHCLPPVGRGTVRRAETDGEVPPEALNHAIREVMHRVCSPACPLHRLPCDSKKAKLEEVACFSSQGYFVYPHLGQVITSFSLLSAEMIFWFSKSSFCSPWAKPGWRQGLEHCSVLLVTEAGMDCPLKAAISGCGCVFTAKKSCFSV